MRIGASTACLYPMETEKAVATLIENGFRIIEIFFNSFSELEPEYLEKLNEYILKIIVRLCLYTHFYLEWSHFYFSQTMNEDFMIL